MKSHLLRALRPSTTSFILFLIICICSCVTDHVIPDPEIPTGILQGSIVIPEKSPIEVKQLKVFSNDSTAVLIDGRYSVDTLGAFATLIVTDENDKIVMLGYSYPGQTNFDISAKSTILAIMMNLPIVFDLTRPGKLALIEKILKDPNLTPAVESLENLLSNGSSFAETPSADLFSKLSMLGKTVSLRQQTVTSRVNPVEFKTAGSSISVQSTGVSHSYAGAVYRNGNVHQSFSLKGRKVLASSILEIYQGLFGEGYTEPGSFITSFTEPGEYNFQLRSGRTFTNTPLDRQGLFLNLATPVADLVLSYFSFGFKNCGKTGADMASKALTYVTAAASGDYANFTEPSSYNALIVQLATDFVNAEQSYLTKCQGEAQKPFFKQFAKLMNFFGKVSLFADTFNVTTHVLDFYGSEAVIDTCFSIRNLRVYPCGTDFSPAKVRIFDGNNQTGVFGKQLLKPLTVQVESEDGAPVEGVEINWDLQAVAGQISSKKTFTDRNGRSSVTWTLGGAGTLEVRATVLSAGKPLEGSPVRFRASGGSEIAEKILGRWKVIKQSFHPSNIEDVSDRDYFLFFASDGKFVVNNSEGRYALVGGTSIRTDAPALQNFYFGTTFTSDNEVILESASPFYLRLYLQK